MAKNFSRVRKSVNRFNFLLFICHLILFCAPFYLFLLLKDLLGLFCKISRHSLADGNKKVTCIVATKVFQMLHVIQID